MPYITASIIMQLLTVVVPTLEKLQKEGELGRRKITQWTRYLTIGLGLAQSVSTAIGLQTFQDNIVIHPGASFLLMTTLSLTTGSALVMWLGEQITERGIGNGMSLIIFTGIVVRLLPATRDLYTNVFVTHDWSPVTLGAVLIMMIAVVAFIVMVEKGERRIPVQYARRMIGQRVTGGQATHMPIKVNAGGVVPVIFASSILAFPRTIANFPMVKNNLWLSHALGAIQHGEPLYIVLFVALITFFCYFYISIIFNPNEAADNMRKIRRLHSGHPAGAAHVRLYEHGPDASDAGWRDLPFDCVPDSGLPDLGNPSSASPADRRRHRPDFPEVHSGRSQRSVLFRRHFAADCGGRGDGHRQPDRSAAHHAPL
jgi:preprotein translocase subunit SecY